MSQYRLELRDLVLVVVRLIGELDAIVRVLAYAQYEDGLIVDKPYLRPGKDGVQEIAAVQEGDVGGCHTVDTESPCDRLDKFQPGDTWDGIPTASVRSVGVFHGIGCAASPEREGDRRRAGPAVVKEKILELEHTNSVSMPSALFADGAGTDVVLRAVRAGSVKLRLELLGLRADGACSGCWDEAGIVIIDFL